MADLMEYVETLADQIGPRPVSTEEEHQASLYIAQELTDEGLEVSVDEFATPTGVRWPYVIAFALSTVGTIVSGIGIFVPGIALSMFIVGLILVVAGFFIYYTERNNQPFLSKMRAGGVSQNVVAKYVPPSVAREARRRKIIICAHVDTVRARPEDGPRFIQHASLLRKILFYVMIALVALLFIRLLPIPWPDVVDNVLWGISIIGCIYVLIAAGCIIASNFTPFIAGGNDNASSAAVMLSVAHLLLNPEDRQRYVPTRVSFQDLDLEDDEYVEEDSELEPVDLDEPEDNVVMHGYEAAIQAGVVPDGAELVYVDDSKLDDATVQFSALPPQEQLGVLADAAADEQLVDGDSTGALSLDDIKADPEQPVSAKAIPQIQVPELEFKLDEQADGEQAEPAERADDAVVFADYMPAAQNVTPISQARAEDEVAPIEEMAVEAAAEAEVIQLHAEPADAVEQVDEDEKPAPAPVYVPIETPAPKRQNRKQVARPVPSWYAAAKEKAAKDLEQRAEETQDEEPREFSYRSRFADTPIVGAMQRPQKEEPKPEEPQEAAEAVEPTETVGAVEAVEEQQASTADAEQIAAVVEQADAILDIEEEPAAPVNIEIPDDQLDELNPDLSGLFKKVVPATAKFAAAAKSETPQRGLTSRIPNIGSSDDVVREERKVVAEERAARDVRPELQSIPVLSEDAVAEEPAREIDVEVKVEVEKPKPAKSAEPAAKPARKKPTARHLTGQFTPTRAVDSRNIQPKSENKQEAPVASSYESTPQASPAVDPFAPKEERRASERARSAAPTSRSERIERTEFTERVEHTATPARSERMTRRTRTEETINAGAGNASFPSLTGNFPALSSSMPVVDAGDFSDRPAVPMDNDTELESFMAAGQTSEISMPESRFRNAVDKVGGLFNRKKRGDEDESQSWEEDDFGWKGGGYYDEEPGSAFEAARERAAQIRDNVVTMTQTDLLDKEVWFVALGASNAGAQGMKNFLDLHASELRGSLIINLEAVGAGKISYVENEGTGKLHRADRRLMSLVKKASKELKGTEMKPKTLDWRNTDATPAMMAGMRAITLMGFAENGVAPVDWHCAEDTAATVEDDNLQYMSYLLLNVIENS